MVRVTEGHDLFTRLRRARGPIRPAQGVDCPDRKSQNEYGPKDSDPRERICAVAKDLGHSLPVSPVKRQKCIVSHQEKQLPSSRKTQGVSPRNITFRYVMH
jgi:hypothetical protein